MTREQYTRQLREIKEDVLLLGSMVQEMLIASVDALKRRDLERAREVFLSDQVINEKRFAIEEVTITTIATQGPMAHDLRLLAAVLEIITDLERMGDYAKGIARITVRLGAHSPLKPLVDIPRMADLGVEMLGKALQAFMDEDVALARAIPEYDDQVDQLYDQIYRELMTFIMADPRVMEQANDLNWIAHKLERFADRVSNICERVVYMATGKFSEFDIKDEYKKLEG